MALKKDKHETLIRVEQAEKALNAAMIVCDSALYSHDSESSISAIQHEIGNALKEIETLRDHINIRLSQDQDN